MKGRLQVAPLASLIVLAGCGGTGTGSSPFRYVYGTGVGPLALPPGLASGYLYGEMANTSRSELTIDAVSLHGPGIGTVVGLAEVKIAPLVAGPDAVPSGQYVTEPPVSLPVGPGGCHKQVLKPVAGYRMPQGGQARIYIVVKALRPGSWVIPRQVVTYTQDGATHQHVFPIRYWGSVSPRAYVSRSAPDDEAKCVGPTGAAYLAGYHAARQVQAAVAT